MALPYQPARGVVEVRMQFTLSGENVENIFHVEHSSLDPWPLADMEDLASVFTAWEEDTAKNLRTTACYLNNVTVTDLTSLTSDRLTRPVVPVIEGTVVGDAAPNSVTFAVKADVHNRGRGKNGRTFWIGLAESQIAGNNIVSATRDSIVSALGTLLNDINALRPAWHLCIVHRIINGVRPAEADFSRVSLYAAADDVLDSQRDRLPNHRRHRKPRA